MKLYCGFLLALVAAVAEGTVAAIAGFERDDDVLEATAPVTFLPETLTLVDREACLVAIKS